MWETHLSSSTLHLIPFVSLTCACLSKLPWRNYKINNVTVDRKRNRQQKTISTLWFGLIFVMFYNNLHHKNTFSEELALEQIP